ncbi:MAG: MG2 domain-containing protein, partial [Bacteroidota bacterium]
MLFYLSGTCLAQSISDQLNSYALQFQTEKVYFAHDKPFYAPGETIWGKVYLVDGSTHQPYAATPVVYVDWVKPDGTVKTSYTLQVNGGSVAVDIPTSLSDTTGTWSIRAYSLYQRNFDEAYLFQKEIRLLDQKVDATTSAKDSIENFTVRLFPEGGHLINGLSGTIAFQARNDKNENIAISGVVVD